MEHKQNAPDELSFVKTVLMLTVVLYHSCLFWAGGWFTGDPALPAPALGGLARYLDTFHIYGFTLVSGYLFSYLKREQGRYGSFRGFVVNKARRLLVPYACVAAFWVIPVGIWLSGYGLREIFHQYVLGTAPGQLWFLTMLFWVFLMAWLLSPLFDRHPLVSGAVVLGIYGVGVLGGTVLPNIFMVWKGCQYLIYFWLGYELRRRSCSVLEKVPSVVWVTAHGVLFLVSGYIAGMDGKVATAMSLAVGLLLHIVGAIMSFFLLRRLGAKLPWKRSPSISRLTKDAMLIYLLHQQVIYMVLALLDGKLSPWLHAPLCFALALLLPMAVGPLLRKSRITRAMIAEK